jgi:uncharacterized protein YndB with AHSA1/START domain
VGEPTKRPKTFAEHHGIVSRGLVAAAQERILAPVSEVWDALINPSAIRRYMFGTEVVSEWREGSPIVWRGAWKGRSYEDKGVILRLEPGRVLSYSHFSPLSGLPESPSSYHTVTIRLTASQDGTLVSLSQDNNETEEAREHSETNWATMLAGLKKLLETPP